MGPHKNITTSPSTATTGVENGTEGVMATANGTEAMSSESDTASGSTSPPSENEVVENGGDSSTKGEGTGEQQVMYVQEAGLVITVEPPGSESFELSVSALELVQEIHQLLMDREDCCHRTCFSLQLDGMVLDNFAELKTIENFSEGVVIKVVEEPYTVREARLHVRHIRDLLKSVDTTDAYTATDGMSLSFLNTVTGGDIMDKKRDRVDSVDCTPPDYIMPGAASRPLLPLHPEPLADQKALQCVRVMTYSGWNPPPGNRKMHGDLLYLVVVTLEDKKFHVTASTRGFYVNQSTDEQFNPRAAAQPRLSHSLIDLLSQVSPAFKRNFATLIKRRGQKHPFERVPTPFQVYSWVAPSTQHSVDYIRAEDAFSTRLGYEEHLPGQTRDWNEELQTCRELKRQSLPERLFRERTIFKVHSDFVGAATRGAMAVIDGSVMPINPGEDPKHQMFLWNNIFFSLGFDVKDHYKDFGGDYAAHVAPALDLQGVRAFTTLDPEGLYTLGTVVVDYRGFRVTAQSIIPGILEKEQEQSVVYGSVDFGKTVVPNEKYLELMERSATQLKLRKHKVLNEADVEVELHSSVECKGIIGNDNRYYVLDLLRTFPPDVNFLPIDASELSEDMREMGFPRSHVHRFPCLRQELVDSFVENRYVAFVKVAALHFQQLRLQKQKQLEQKKEDEKKQIEGEKSDEAKTDGAEKKEDLEVEEAKKMVQEVMGDGASLEEKGKEVVRQAAKAVGSLKETEFDISFNPDVYQPHVKHPDPQSAEHEHEKKIVREAGEFLVKGVIPGLLKEFLEHTSSPVDGITLTEAMHARGINMRYLGNITDLLAKEPKLKYIHRIAVCEVVCRATKHVWRAYSQDVAAPSLAPALSHFLNCLLGACATVNPQTAGDELQSKNMKKKNKRRNRATISEGSTDWQMESPKSLWRRVKEEIKSYYCCDIACESVESVCELHGLHKLTLLRSLCQRIGLQIRLREYALDNKAKAPFTEEDILNLQPVVKHGSPKASDAYHFFSTGQNRIQQGMLREGYELISEALNLLNNVCGPMHPEIAACLRLLARLNYILGDPHEALSYQQKAVLMSERVLGVDHPNTITDYTHLALYCFASGQVSCALRLLYRARYLALLCCGEEHPDVALLDSNIGLILHAVGEFELSLKFLEHALAVNKEFYGPEHMKVALSNQLAARAQSFRGEFRQAIQREKDAYVIYKTTLGGQHERSVESNERLKKLTQQAVQLQRHVTEMSRGERRTMPPIQVQPPPAAGVLETLNTVNGIVFFHISAEELERLRTEIARRQQQPATPADKQTETDEQTAQEGKADTETAEAEATTQAPEEAVGSEQAPQPVEVC